MNRSLNPSLIRLGVALIVSICIAPGTSTAQTRAREIAITFDDLPLVSQTFATDIAAQSTITARLLSSLARAHIPAIGFVNEGKLFSSGTLQPERVALLKQWIDAGFELGNHSYSHLDLHTTPLATYWPDVARGDSVTRALLLAANKPPPRWFRHPFLHTGRDSTTRSELERSLSARGYRVAPVTVDNNEYIFAAAYDRLIARRDSATMRRVSADYVAYMTAVIAYYEQQSRALFGREIRQVLLVHANVLNADHFGEIARMLAGRGYTFIPIERAVEDTAYRSPDTYVGPAGITWIHRWALTQGKRGAFFAGEPVVPEYIDRLAAPAR